jgi:hypothetical protein
MRLQITSNVSLSGILQWNNNSLDVGDGKDDHRPMVMEFNGWIHLRYVPTIRMEMIENSK